MSRFSAPVRRKGAGYVIDIGRDESSLVLRLLGELRALLRADDPDAGADELLLRLFPVAYPEDDEMEAEYQRLMRDDLVQSKLSSIEIVERVLGGDGKVDPGELLAFMQSINSLRLVLGSMLDVSDDPDVGEVDDDLDDSPEFHLYGYLSWLLEWTVTAQAGE